MRNILNADDCPLIREEWIYGTCRSFSDATGWRLEFTSTKDFALTEIKSRRLEWAWYAEISNGISPIGFVHLHYPESYTPSVTFESVYRLADLIVVNINRFLREQAQVYEQAMEIGMLISANGQSDFRKRLHALLRSTVCLASFRSAALFVLTPDGSALRARLCYNDSQAEIPYHYRPLNEHPPDLDSLDSGLCLIQRNENDDERWIPDSMNSAVCLPVESQTGPIGTLWLYDRRFKQRDTLPYELLKGFAGRIADVLDRIVLLQDAEKCDRMTRELDIIASTTEDTRDIETSYPGCDVAIRCLSRLEVGGDLCETVPLDQYHTALVIGDASGDSIPAAMVMTATRGALHALLEKCRSRQQIPVPHEFVEELNRAILHVTAAQQFITLLFGIFDSRTGTLKYTNAGHCPPLHVRSGSVTELESHGLLLGVLNEATYLTAEVALHADDMLVLFSDGIIEARNSQGNMFQNKGIISALTDRNTATASATLQTVWAAYENHTGGRNLDDRTLMVIRGTHNAVPASSERRKTATVLCH